MTSKTAPTSVQKTLGEELAGAFDWWREAGVDLEYADEPADRLADAAAEREAQEAATKPKQPEPVVTPEPKTFTPQAAADGAGDLAKSKASWPTTLEAFREWWLADESLAFGGGHRVSPRGEAGAELMVLLSQPEQGDQDQLLAGPQGKLLAGFLRATGLSPDQTYTASSLPSHMALPDWQALREAGLGDLTRHHITLAKPKRVLAFGRNILPLLGHDQAQGPAQLTLSEGTSDPVQVLGAPGLEELLRSGPRRKRLWHSWLDWSA